jgi:ABC-type nitrate/sulfonate/bicarbonate transport system substrate-binding protein
MPHTRFPAQSVLHYPLTAERAAASPKPDPVRIKLALISEGIINWPLYAAQAQDLFAHEGLAVDATLTGSSVRQLEDLTAGRYDIGFQQPDHVVRAVEQGSDLFVFMANGHAPEVTLVAAPGIATIADLAGKTVVVDGARTGYALLLHQLLSREGLKDGDYSLLEVGGSRERFDALQSGRAAASLLNSPFDRTLLASGFGSLGKLSGFFPAYPGSIAACSRSWAGRNRGTLVAFIRAMDTAYDWLRDPAHETEALALFPAHLAIEPQVARAALARFAAAPRPAITAQGMRQVIDVVYEAEGYPGPRGTPEKYMDLAYSDAASAR